MRKDMELSDGLAKETFHVSGISMTAIRAEAPIGRLNSNLALWKALIYLATMAS